MLDVREYLDEDGTSPFAAWFAGLEATAAAKITVVLGRIEQGNLSNVKGVGEGVLEFRLDFGPGYRVYFGRDGDVLVILLAGGVETGKTILRDYIKATVGFEQLGAETGSSPKSLIRMFGPTGNPQARNLFAVISHLQRHAGLTLQVTARAQ